jgi:hypothetical protein
MQIKRNLFNSFQSAVKIRHLKIEREGESEKRKIMGGGGGD